MPEFLRCVESLDTGHGSSISCLRLSPCSTMLATGSADRSINLWKIDEGRKFQLLGTLKGHFSGITDVCWSPDGRYLCSSSDDQLCMIWSVGKLRCVRVLRGHSNLVFCVAFNGRGAIVASGSFDESIRIWDVMNERCIRTIAAHSDPISTVAFSSGEILASGSYDGLIRLWNVETGQCLKTIVDYDNPPVSFLRFSPNGRYLLVGTLDNTLRLWNHATGKCVRSFTGHQNERLCCFSDFYDSDHVVSGDEKGRLFVWNIHSRDPAPVSIMHAHNGNAHLPNEVDSILCTQVGLSGGEPFVVTASVSSAEAVVKLWLK